ncbi:hypothetical protein JYU34_007185 [Plutella xylostella]|uniref:Uncharacterized protein n=1 Tax=Plutella xylostella TaxID=51655 RepID=A0ABQ7QPT4_PLUXY|nr:hypothetical protein JYU34_007185 [Plutella xylostella]
MEVIRLSMRRKDERVNDDMRSVRAGRAVAAGGGRGAGGRGGGGGARRALASRPPPPHDMTHSR